MLWCMARCGSVDVIEGDLLITSPQNIVGSESETRAAFQSVIITSASEG